MATLNPARRKNLVLAAATVYERQIELNGPIVEANWEESSFQMRLADGALVTLPMPESFHPQVCSYGGRIRHHVTVKGFASYDSWDKLQKVVSVDSLEVQKDFHLAARFDELRSLESGWHDGAGMAPDKEALDQVADRLVGHFPESLPLPASVPTPEGNLLLEWNSAGDPSLDISLSDMTAEVHAFRDETDVEESFVLAAPDEWKRLFAALAASRPAALFFAGDLGQRILQQPFPPDIPRRGHPWPLTYPAHQPPHLPPDPPTSRPPARPGGNRETVGDDADLQGSQ